MEIDEETLKSNLKKLNESQLKDKCEKLGVDQSGDKEEVIQRILLKVVISAKSATRPSSRSASVDAVNADDTKAEELVYTKEHLKTLTKAQLSVLIESMYRKNEMMVIILRRQRRNLREVDEGLKERNARKNHNVFYDPHEKVVHHIAFGEKNATDYAKIERQREIIKQLKEKRKNQNRDSLKERNNARKNDKVFADPHEKVGQSVAFGEKKATDYVKIEKQREIIKQLKEKRKGHNDLKSRNAQRDPALFSEAHEKVVTVKPLKQPEPKNARRRRRKNGNNRKKIVDPVSKGIMYARKKLQMKNGSFEYDGDDNEDDLDYDDDDEDYDFDDEDDEDYDDDESDEAGYGPMHYTHATMTKSQELLLKDELLEAALSARARTTSM